MDCRCCKCDMDTEMKVKSTTKIQGLARDSVGCLRYGFSIVDFPTECSRKSLKNQEVKLNDAVL